MNILRIVRSITLLIAFALIVGACPQKKAKFALDENRQITLLSVKNNDKSIKEKIILTVEQVKDVQRFVRQNFPNFVPHEDDDWEKYRDDDFNLGLLVNDFNRYGPQHCVIYLAGIEKYAGYSSVVALLNGHLYDDEPELWGYYFFIDEEYSDQSGISFSDTFWPTKGNNSLCLWKEKYANTDNYYWEVLWPWKTGELYTQEEKEVILTSFIKQLRSKIVFNNMNTE
jgi:hypothetical protein